MRKKYKFGGEQMTNKNTPKNFEEFLKILEITKFNSQVEKGKNQYVFS